MKLSSGLVRGVCGASLVVVLAILPANRGLADDASKATAAARAIDGREIFAREWIPGDKRSHGGDGLGPMFNDSSCVACHNLGGIGGAGPASKNVEIVTAFKNNQQGQGGSRSAPSISEAFVRSLFGTLDGPREGSGAGDAKAEDRAAEEKARLERLKALQDAERKQLAQVHPGFQFTTSVVLHRSATYDGYEGWRSKIGGLSFGGMPQGAAAELRFFGPDDAAAHSPAAAVGSGQTRAQMNVNPGQILMNQMLQEARFAQNAAMGFTTQHGNFAVLRSQRNTTALFGAGKIDAVPVALLEELERKQADKKEVSGRIARLKDGTAGRFGWKAQTSSLREFVLTACAVEVGLNVPDHPQAGVPQKADYAAPGLDLNAAECDALIRYVRDLPAPPQRQLSDPADSAYVQAGQALFNAVGCAECHVADVGEAKGIFSDLLVHDLGQELGDTGSYGVFVPDSTPDGQSVPPIGDFADTRRSGDVQIVTGPIIGATRQEWRTPPLWGVRDSAPYLHDGRARTLEQAIALHGGEGTKSAQKFFALSAAERFQVVTFLKSLVAPDQLASVK